MPMPNVCPAEKRTKHSSILLLRLVRFSAGQTLCILMYDVMYYCISVRIKVDINKCMYVIISSVVEFD